MTRTNTEEQKYFIAVVPPDPLFRTIHDVKNHFREVYNARAALRSPPHITLHMPFLWNERKESKLISVLSEFATAINPFELTATRFGSFPPRVIFVALEESPPLVQCQHALHRFCKINLNLFNANYQERPFHPHMTVAFRDLRKEAFSEAWKEFEHRSIQASFTVDRLCLLKHDGKEWKVYASLPFASTTS